MTQSTAIITGGGGGMGLACARLLSKDYRILLVEIDPDRLERALTLLAEAGTSASGRVADISDHEQTLSLAEWAREEGTLGALIHTAGLSPTMASGDRIWKVNLVGSANLLHALSPQVGPDCVAILIASQAAHFLGDTPSPELQAILEEPLAADLIERIEKLSPDWLEPGIAYAAAKLGVLRLAVRTALEWGPRGARVVSLSPGMIETGMGKQEYAAQPFMKTMLEKTPLQRMGKEDEIAQAVKFLCSSAASFITATDLLVDGGSTAAVRHMVAGPRSE